MNGGGHPQDNNIVSSSTSKLTQSGAYRFIKVKTEFEILQADGTVSIVSGVSLTDSKYIVVINSAPQWEEDAVYYNGGAWNNNISYFFNKYSSSTDSFLTKCPNFSSSSGSGSEITKDVRLTDEAEWLYFWIFRIYFTGTGGAPTDYGDKIMLEVTTSDATTVYLDDFQSLLQTPFNSNVYQRTYCAQNISPILYSG